MVKRQKTVAVFGGTGFIGSAIVRQLLQKNFSVRIITRNPKKIAGRFPKPVEGVQADLKSPGDLGGVLEGCSYVVYSVVFKNAPMENPRRGATWKEVDYRGITHVLKELEGETIDRLLYISGIGADKDSPLSWCHAKGLAEEAIEKSGHPYTILRPSWVYGPEDHALNRLRRLIRFSPVIPLIGDGEQKIQPIFIDDLSQVAVQALTCRETTNRIFEIGGPEIVTLNQVIQKLLKVLNRRREILHMPLPLISKVARLLELFPNPILTRRAIPFFTMSATADNEPWQKRIPLPLKTLEEGFSSYL